MKEYFLTRLPDGDKIELKNKIITIGRDPSNEVIVTNPAESRVHCKLIRSIDGYYIQDVASSNGTFVNAEKISGKMKLHHNDTISLSIKGSVFQYTVHINFFQKKYLLGLIPALLLLSLGLSLLASRIFPLKRTPPVIPAVEEQWTIKGLDIPALQKEFGAINFPNDADFTLEIIQKMKNYNWSRYFKTGLERRERYIELIYNTLDDHNVPRIYSFLPFVESWYSTDALNQYSGARGMWQLMPSTAREYGLTVNNRLDERIDVSKSSRAAAMYIRDLLAIFGHDSFALVCAAYNAGDGRVRAALRRIKDPEKHRSFWYLCQKDLIPLETQNYVTKLYALIILTRRAEALKTPAVEKAATPVTTPQG